MTTPVQPILVCMSWRGGPRLDRCLVSIAASRHQFSRVIISVTSTEDSEDMRLAVEFQRHNPNVEVLCTGQELPTMQHQAFWVDYLMSTGASRGDWIYWLAYDDEVRLRGIEAIIDQRAGWPLTSGTAYFGPWAMRHEGADSLWSGNGADLVEVWTSLPLRGSQQQPVAHWIRDQLRQPTYIQMSGSVCEFGCFIDLHTLRPVKRGPMRIEMAIASTPGNRFVAEFDQPISIIYGRSNSDRASYGKAARSEDAHLIAWLARYASRHPRAVTPITAGLASVAAAYAQSLLGGSSLPAEEWRVRGHVRA